MSNEHIELTDMTLLYSATSRCRCGAGLAHPLHHGLTLELRAWTCSYILKNGHFVIGGYSVNEDRGVLRDVPRDSHDSFPFALWKVREETSINNAGGWTTRPAGTRALTVGHATCPKCAHTWQSEPYSACGASHHWIPGPCPGCGYGNGSGTSWSTRDGEPIEKRYTDVVLEVP